MLPQRAGWHEKSRDEAPNFGAGQDDAGQRKTLAVRLAALDARPGSTNVIEGGIAMTPSCSHCGAERIMRNGQADGPQRYECCGCNKTFNSLTWTALARLRHKGKRFTQAAIPREGQSIHKAAERLNVAPSTAFRWRHRFRALPKTLLAQPRVDIAEADTTYLLHSRMGQRSHRPANSKARGQGQETRCVR